METIHFILLMVVLYILYIIYNRIMLVFTGYDAEGIDKNGYDKEGFHSKHGFNQDGYNRDGYNNKTKLFRDTGTKFDKDGYDNNGFDKDGYYTNGFNKNGYNKSGFDKDGFSTDGYGKDGYDKRGWNRDGYNKRGFDKTGYDRYDNDAVYGYPRNLTIDKLVLNPHARYRFYYLKLIHKGNPLYKIGITSTTVHNRYTSHTSESITYNYKILFDKKADNAEEFELALKVRHKATYLKLLGTKGSEIYDTDILSLDNITERAELKSEIKIPEIDLSEDEDFPLYDSDEELKGKSKSNLSNLDNIIFNDVVDSSELIGLSSSSCNYADERWMEELWNWADDYGIPELDWLEYEERDKNGFAGGLPRDKEKLLALEELNLSNDGYDILELPPGIYRLTNLKKIYLENFTLFELSKEIGNLINLTEFTLHGDAELIEPPTELFTLTNLRVLNLGERGLAQVPKEIGNLVNLEVLHIAKSPFGEWPKEIGSLVNLRKLYLGGNGSINQVAKEIGNLVNLEELHLGGIQLVEWPKEIGSLVNLRKLYLNSNGSATQVPKEIGNLTNLVHLALSGDQLTEIPEEICKLSNLTYLNLSHTQLNILSKEIANLTNLTQLYLMDTQLTEIPREISNLVNLTYLNLSRTPLNKLPKEIGNLTNLTYLGLSDTPLTKMPEEICNLVNLGWPTFVNNPNIILSTNQKEWVKKLSDNGYMIVLEEDD